MTYRIDRIAGRVIAVNAFVIHGPDGLVVVDGMLTVSDAALVRRAIDAADVPLAGVVVTHPRTRRGYAEDPCGWRERQRVHRRKTSS